MEFTITFALVSLVILIACIIAFVYNSNRIIKIQEREIAKLRAENFRLQAKLCGKQRVMRAENGTQVVEIHDDRINPDNIPDYSDEW